MSNLTSPTPKVGFVSLGCPKALVDSEQILTQLRAEGYETAKSYDGAALVIVNTCGFIDAAVAESLDAIGEALAENGKVIVTGCLGAKQGGDVVRNVHPSVLAVTGPHATQEVMAAVHEHLPKPHDPFSDLIPPQGIRLTPKHFAYLKISEGCNHRCTFCIIPSMPGDLETRTLDDEIRPGIRRGNGVSLGAQLREDLLGVDGGLGAAEGNEADFRRLDELLARHYLSSLPAWPGGKPGN
jgi:ribosomal protein S12 methylthiotransferase